MINAFYSAVSGMTSFQNRLNISANNMANVNTSGFKAQTASFSDLVYTDVYTLKEQEKQISVGNGVRLSGTSSLMEEGGIEHTGRSLDVAILGEGYFKVKDNNDNEFYTRAGNFQIQSRDNENYLVTSNGETVLDDNGQEIIIPEGNVIFKADNSQIEDTSTDDQGQANVYVKIGVYKLENPYALVRDGYGRLSASEASGEGEVFYEAKINQGALENSNVDMTGEMTNLMLAQRGFLFSSRVLQAVDELENTANNLRG